MKKRITIFTSMLLILVVIASLMGMIACKKKPDDNKLVFDEDAIKAAYLSDSNDVKVSSTNVTFRDISGEEKSIKKGPKKVFVLYASLTTLWYEAGGTAQGCIGGKSSIGTYMEYIGRDITKDEGVTVLANSSSSKTWKVEDIVNMAPDLIICAKAMGGYDKVKLPAGEANIPVIGIDYSNYKDYLKWFKVFCEINEKSNLWSEIAEKSLNDVMNVLKEVPRDKAPQIFSAFVGPMSLQANLSATVVGGMAKELGAHNIADEWKNESNAQRLDINMETVYAKQPEAILIQIHTGGANAEAVIEEKLGSHELWKELDAVKNNRVYVLNDLYFHNKPNSKFAKAYQMMAKMLYPDTTFSF